LLLWLPLNASHAQEITPQTTGTLCFYAFDDLDQDGRRDAGENIKAGVNIVVSTQTADILNYDTDGSEPFCLSGLTPGDYLITHVLRPGEIDTTVPERTFALEADDELEVGFGSYNPPVPPTAVPTTTGTPLPTLPPLGPTATANTEGVIYVSVFANDSLTSVAFRAGITLATLLELNGLTDTSIIHPGDQLIVGFVTPPATETIAALPPTETPTRPPPTATNTAVPPPRTALCLVAFEDSNVNGIYESGEALRMAVAFTIFNENSVVGNLITDGVSESHCLDLAPGTYQVTRSSRPDETLTSEDNGLVVLGRGDVVQLSFGSTVATPAPGIQPITNEEATAVPPIASTPLPLVTPAANAATSMLAPTIIITVIVALLFAGGLVIWLVRSRA
jgi:hypothetical protein